MSLRSVLYNIYIEGKLFLPKVLIEICFQTIAQKINQTIVQTWSIKVFGPNAGSLYELEANFYDFKQANQRNRSFEYPWLCSPSDGSLKASPIDWIKSNDI